MLSISLSEPIFLIRFQRRFSLAGWTEFGRAQRCSGSETGNNCVEQLASHRSSKGAERCINSGSTNGSPQAEVPGFDGTKKVPKTVGYCCNLLCSASEQTWEFFNFIAISGPFPGAIMFIVPGIFQAHIQVILYSTGWRE